MTQKPQHWASLVWITPNAEDIIVQTARVSSDPKKKHNSNARLLQYLLTHEHWSPFEMANLCVEVNSSRDIVRQMLRHWTMRPQEFSQRYEDPLILGGPILRDCRLQDRKNRQNSIRAEASDPLNDDWREAQERVWRLCSDVYEDALERGIAKEVARVVLPEGMTPSKAYFNMPVRSALHFCALRSHEHGAQQEIVWIAEDIWSLIERHMPTVALGFARHKGWHDIVESDRLTDQPPQKTETQE